ncbi:aminoglycoside phosphotransferase (APT) family kinase protein [Hamadaea flava]|uniref:Phosphotransferase family protein n=1 Tax=Hamadaea flava TaxID=1742688 RepID=A0ABV8M0V9_9ACTN|nr:phosphotransferase [Hamadaea flava]MCP2322013.1 aminoglycoside phosphotransferase (APT) family kinase protein [Hamadaea flava]
MEAEPSPAALTWVAAATGAPVRHARRLAGGTHAATHLLRFDGSIDDLVLRRFRPGDPAVVRESTVLAALDGLGGWAPRLVAADPAGAVFGEPAVLTTRIPGDTDIATPHPEPLGRALARLHGVPVGGLAGFRDGMAVTAAGGASRAMPAARARLAEQERVLTHFDYWTGNVLWAGDVLTGIIDWSGASLAPRGFDISWCRLDLVLLHGPAYAEVFLDAYQEAAGVTVPELRQWDLFALANADRDVETWIDNYHDLGRTDLSAADLRSRHTAWTERRRGDD